LFISAHNKRHKLPAFVPSYSTHHGAWPQVAFAAVEEPVSSGKDLAFDMPAECKDIKMKQRDGNWFQLRDPKRST